MSENEHEEIVSPPFPTSRTTVPRLLKLLKELREWVVSHREWANWVASEHGATEEIIPEADQIPKIMDQKRFLGIGVADIFSTHVNMRRLRESWDALVRVHEETWDSKPALIWRLQCVRSGYIILTEAFVDPETREAKQEQAHRKKMRQTKKILRKMGVPKEMLEGNAFLQLSPFGVGMGFEDKHPKDIDFDKLFHGEDSDELPEEEDEEE